MIVLRFQAVVSTNPYVGRWSVILDVIDADGLEPDMIIIRNKIRHSLKINPLTPADVTTVLNIIPSFIENSLFWTFSSSPATGTNGPVVYEGFVEAIRTGESVLVGPIENGQPGVIQVKDVVKDRSKCTA
jgi:hypothetical protein